MNFQASKLGLRIEMAGLWPRLHYLLSTTRLVLKTLAWLTFPFLLTCWYYSTFFQWTHRTYPTEGLNYVTDTDAPQRNDFRKRTVSAVTDPLRQELDRIKALRKQTKSGTVRPPTFEQDAIEIRIRLKEIMTEARLRRIPKEFQKNYEPVLHALAYAFYSINDLEDCFEQETEADRHKLYNNSVKKWKSAELKCKITHDYFTSDEWRDWSTVP